jgi:subtilase family serine protease
VTNTGSDEATDIVVRIYAGDPSSGGQVLGEDTIEGPLEPGEDETITIDVGQQSRNLTIWAVADPDDAITECNDANNVDEGPTLDCDEVPR